MARYAKKRFGKKFVRKFGKRRGRAVVKRGGGGNSGGVKRRLNYDNRFPVKNALYSGKPAYIDSSNTGTSAPTDHGNLRGAPLRGRVPGGDVVRLGENTSMSSAYLGGRKSGMRSMLSNSGNGGIKKLYGNSVGQFNSTTGIQEQFTVGTLNRTDLNSVKTILDADLPTEMKAGNNDLKIYFGETVSRLHMKNQTNHVACVVLYDIVPKRTSDNSSLDSPVEAWIVGTNQQGFADYRLYPGNSPYESKEFTKRFSVVKTTRLYMEPGEQHEHVFVRRINKVFSSTLWDSTAASAGEAIIGLTGFTMVVAYGSIGHASTDAPNTVSYMPVRIDYIHHLTSQFQYVGTTLKKTQISTNNISTVAPAAWSFLAESADIDAPLQAA